MTHIEIMKMTLNDKELSFVEQKELFVAKTLEAIGASSLEDLPDLSSRPPIALMPTLVRDFEHITAEEAAALEAAYWGEHGVAYFQVLNLANLGITPHPIIKMAAQLQDRLPLKFSVNHPMEGHPEAVRRFGPPDGTLKIYDLENRDGSTGYREIAETTEQFDAHNDGLGYAGAVEAFALYADSVPIAGGYTYFQNVVRLSLLLAKTDPDAFASLFLPDALTALRPRGKGAIKVTTPVLFVNEFGMPQCFLRVSTGEYKMTWRRNCKPLERAARFLNSHARPFAPGSTFVNLSRPGSGCMARNGWLVHGRTAFLNGEAPSERRVLARKWFMTREEHAHYKHVPGMHILERYAAIFPERFGPEMVVGDWNYDPSRDCNVRRA